ncbi:MAG TPA: TonB-dependent receptor [Vicinamibacterales bacterium]|nr:TonB-dependent receptor [Vicinamibacterales bacterium]
MPRVALLLAWIVLVVIVPSPSSAQAGGSGTIQGTVLDNSGGAVPGATVTATNADTGIETIRQTTAAGVYSLAPLSPGRYTVTVTLDGFQRFVRDGVVVDALSVVGLNATLQVAGVNQEVMVSAASPPPLATADARLGQTIRNEVYTALPLVLNTGGPRDPTQFMFLMPGVQSIGRWGNVMGGQDFTTDMYVEGIPITNSVVQGEGRNLQFGFSVEAIDQFQVETSGTAVMYNGQGASNYVIKSGTNTLRGSAFELMRNKALDAKAFFSTTKPDDNQHEYGATAGGPIQKNRMFFFAAYDGYRDRRQTPAALISIPTMAERNGDFSALPIVIYDPRTTRPNPNGTGFIRDPFPGNIIPQDRISPISRYFQSFLPDPTNGGLQNNYLGGTLPTGFNNDNVTGKVDVKLDARQQLSVLFAYGKRRQDSPYRGGNTQTNPQVALPLPYTETRLVEEAPTSAQVKYTLVASAQLVNQLNAGFARLSVPIFNATIDGQYPINAGLRGLPAGEANSAFPEISWAGPNAPTQWRGTDARAFTEYLNNYTLQDNVTWTRGRHLMTFGLQAQRMDADERERTYGSLATFGFSNVQTAGFNAAGTLQTTTGNAYASFLLGELNATSVIEDSQVATSGRFYDYAMWAQDNVKVRPNLTVNLGLRYDIMKPYTEAHDRWSFMNPTQPNPAVGGYPGAVEFAGDGADSCGCRTPIATYLGGLGPRLGVAYSPTERSVVRAAYGINYSRRGAVGGRAGARNGTGTLGFSANASFPSANGFDPAYNWNNGVPAYAPPPFFDPSLNAGFVTGRGTGGSVTYGDPDIGGRPPRYQNWNAGVQIAPAGALTLGVTYAGSRGDFLGGSGRGIYSNQLDPKYLVLGNLLTQQATPANIATAAAIVPGIGLPYAAFSGTISQMLRPFPQYSAVSDVYGDVASSNYHSLQFTAEKRRSDDGLAVSFNYTYSRTRDNLTARTGYNFDQDWAVGVNDQPHVWNVLVVYDVPFGSEGKPGSGNSVVRAIVRDWQVSGITQFRSGRPLGSILAACNLPNAGTCYADFAPGFTGDVRINGDYGDGDVLSPNPPSYIDRAAFQSPAPFTFGNTPRTLAYDLRNPSSWNQDLSVRRDIHVSRARISVGFEVFNLFNTVVFGGIQTNITSAAFGRVSSQVNTPRVGQIKLHVDF